jgi:hypothetical protein
MLQLLMASPLMTLTCLFQLLMVSPLMTLMTCLLQLLMASPLMLLPVLSRGDVDGRPSPRSP